MKVAENFFDGKKMQEWYCKLKDYNAFEDFKPKIEDKITIITHDDDFDLEMHEYEKQIGIKSTFFVFSDTKSKPPQKNKDIQLHYNKENKKTLTEQISEFKKNNGFAPKFNRNHKLWWRETHLDLAHLAMNNIVLDSTIIGTQPFRLCVQGKILPIWEVPFSIVDIGAVDIKKNIHSTYNKAKLEIMIKNEVTPIISLYHPYLKATTNWKEYPYIMEKAGYKIMTMQQFYEKYLKKYD